MKSIPYYKAKELEEDSYANDQYRYHSDKKYLEGSRYDESVVGSSLLPIACPPEAMSQWRIKKKIKTQGLILSLCLNFDQFPDEMSNSYGLRDECWINLNSIVQKKNTYDLIAKTLQRQYENQIRTTTGIRTKQLLDPSSVDLETACEQMRSNNDKSVQSRIIFHYNGHGVPVPTPLGELWVFNKNFDKYKAVSMISIHTWLKTPTMYVMDCSHAGQLLQELNTLNMDGSEDETRDVYFLGACDINECIPIHHDFPGDIFTACITDPLRMYIKWLLYIRSMRPAGLNQPFQDEDTIDEDFAYRLSGTYADRNQPKGELRMIFECITDSIAWSFCDIETYKELFKTDEMVASLFHNFLLAQRIMAFFNCHPVSKPAFPDLSSHHLWKTMDAVMEEFIQQLTLSQRQFRLIREDELRSNVEKSVKKTTSSSLQPTSRVTQRTYISNTFDFKTNFFRHTVTELYTYVRLSRNMSEIPECFPMLYMLINSDEISQQLPSEQSINVIELLAAFAERSNESVSAILVTVNINSLKRMSLKAQRNHRSPLLRLWTCITAFDYRVYKDITENLFPFLFSFLRLDAEPKPTSNDIIRVLFLLTVSCHECEKARMKCCKNGVHQVIRKYLKSEVWKLRLWTCLLLYQLCWECNELKEFIYYDSSMNDILNLLSDPYPEVRTAAILLLQSFVGFLSPVSSSKDVHCYFTNEEIEQLINTEDPSMKRDQIMLENTSKYVLMNRECSVLVRRELFRLILKVLSQRNHMAHMILLVDRILKNDIDIDLIMNHIDSEKSKHSHKPIPNQFYLKYWIMILSLRDAEPQASIRKAASQYVYIICKNVDNLKNKGKLPTTTSIFDFAKLIQLSVSQKGMNHRTRSVTSLPTVATPVDLLSNPSTDVTNLPLLTTNSIQHTHSSGHTPHVHHSSSSNSNMHTHPLPDNAIPPMIPTVSTTPLPITDTITPPFIQSGTSISQLPPVSTSQSPFSNFTTIPSPHSHHHPSATPTSLIPPAISTSPSFSNLQLMQSNPTEETATHIDHQLEMQVSLLGLPETFNEWCINCFIQHPPSPKHDIMEFTKQTSHNHTVSEEKVNELSAYKQSQFSLRFKTIKPVVLKDMFTTKKASLTSLSFHPYYSVLAIGMEQTTMIYDYQEQKQFYLLDNHFNSQTTSIEWINPSSSALLVEATRKGAIYIWKIPSIEKKQQPSIVSSFLAFPAFAKQPQDEKNMNSIVLDWNQTTGQLAAAGTTQLVKVWDMDQERLLCCKETGYHSPVVSVKSSSEFIYHCCLSNGIVMAMDTRCKEIVNQYSTSLSSSSSFVNMSVMNNGTLVVGQLDGHVHMIDPRVLQPIKTVQLPSLLSSIQAHPVLPLIAATSLKSELSICDLEGNVQQSIRTCGGFREASLGYLKSVAYHPLDNCIATYNSDGIVYVFN